MLIVLAVLSLGSRSTLPTVMSNDNRTPAGAVRNGVREIVLNAQLASWRPDTSVDTAITVMAFGERGTAPRIPGPLVRVTRGERVRIIVENSLQDSVLVVRGLVPGDSAHLRIARGRRDSVEFIAGSVGTFLYWGSTSDRPFSERAGREAQLTGAFIVDDPERPAHPSERVFVITTTDVFPDTLTGGIRDDLFDQAINGLSWPHTERLTYAVGDTVRWRWVNGGYLPHPMHLHGFHFRTTAKGNGRVDTLFTPDNSPEVVTEFMRPGSTFAMDFVPTRAGNWLFHCHMSAHVTPFPFRTREQKAHAMHDPLEHVQTAMSGLVIGLTVTGQAAAPTALPAERRWVYAQQSTRPILGDTAFQRGYVVRNGAEPRADSVVVPGQPIFLTRGVRTAITVVNRLSEPTTVHWHGMELESYYDGVSGFSGAGSQLTPMIAPGDSFTAVMTPPRAGTFMYHPHMEEADQLTAGLYAPMLVLPPGEPYDASRELLVIIGHAVTPEWRGFAVNGSRTPAPLDVVAGRTYRVRILNIGPNEPRLLDFRRDTTLLRWGLLAKDGADAPEARRREVPARLIIGVGETYDFLWTPGGPMEASMKISVPQPNAPTIALPVRVRP